MMYYNLFPIKKTVFTYSESLIYEVDGLKLTKNMFIFKSVKKNFM